MNYKNLLRPSYVRLVKIKRAEIQFQNQFECELKHIKLLQAAIFIHVWAIVLLTNCGAKRKNSLTSMQPA